MDSNWPAAHRRGLYRAVTAQFFGMLGMNSFENGIMLLYLTVLGVSPARILAYLAIPNALSTVFRLPTAFLADRYGKKRLGSIGVFMVAAGYAAVPFAGSVPVHTAELLLVAGFSVLAIGKMLFACSWIAMLSALIPEDRRGRVFAGMRFLFRVSNIVVGGACAYVLSEQAPVGRFQAITAVFAVGFLVRAVLYRGIPELDPAAPADAKFGPTLGRIVRTEGYAGFCAYVFMLTLFTAGCNSLFVLVEKNVLQFGNGLVVFLVNLGVAGGLLGLFLGGRAVDRWGSKYVFLFCHFGFSLGITGFLARGIIPLPPAVTVGTVHFFFGMVGAASGLAITTEMLGLIPQEDKALSTSLLLSMILGGSSLAGFISAGILKLGVIREQWMLFGRMLSDYDAILLGYAGMIVLVTVALGQVPSVLRKTAWLPKTQ